VGYVGTSWGAMASPAGSAEPIPRIRVCPEIPIAVAGPCRRSFQDPRARDKGR